MVHGRPDRLVLSFHGLPKRAVDRGDPYQAECMATAAALIERLKLPARIADPMLFTIIVLEEHPKQATYLDRHSHAASCGLRSGPLTYTMARPYQTCAGAGAYAFHY